MAQNAPAVNTVLDGAEKIVAHFAPMKVDSWEIVELLARELGVTTGQLRIWRQRAVPHRYRLPIADLARKRKLDFDPAWFDRPARKNGRRAA